MHSAVHLAFGVAKLIILVKNRFRSYACGFSAQSNYYRPAHKVAQEQSPPQKPPTRAAATTTRRYNSRYFCDFKTICLTACHDHANFCLCLLWWPFVISRSLGKIPTSGPVAPTVRPNLEKPPARQRPQKTLQGFFIIFPISTLRPSSQDFQRFWYPSKTF